MGPYPASRPSTSHTDSLGDRKKDTSEVYRGEKEFSVLFPPFLHNAVLNV